MRFTVPFSASRGSILAIIASRNPEVPPNLLPRNVSSAGTGMMSTECLPDNNDAVSARSVPMISEEHVGMRNIVLYPSFLARSTADSISSPVSRNAPSASRFVLYNPGSGIGSERSDVPYTVRLTKAYSIR